MSFYVCTTFDEFDHKTGFYVMKMDCISWDENILGAWTGPSYSTKDECYAKSTCLKTNAVNSSIIESNNYCNISIVNASLIEINNNFIVIDIELPEIYQDTYLEYALYNIDNNLINDFKRVSGPTLSKNFNITIPNPEQETCAIAFRLVRPCDVSGSESGSVESGPSVDNLLFDKSSWAGTVPAPFSTWLDIAADSWHNLVKINSDITNNIKSSIDPNWNGIALVSYTEINDPLAGYVAACGPVSVVNITNNDPSDIKYNTLSFQLYINTYYYNNPSFPLSSADWIGVMKHELGHALGIGTLWSTNISNFLDGTIYTNSINAYNSIINESSSLRSLVPIEDSGAPGTVGVHWENNDRDSLYPNGDNFNYPSCNFDIMVGFITIGSPKNISSLSKQFLVDIGYDNNNLPAISINNPSTIINNNNATILPNMCGCSHCCDDHHCIGTINLIDNTFTASHS